MGSREDKVYRYEPRENDAVNACWMCDYGRLNYKWIGREDRLTQVQSPKSKVQSQSILHAPRSTLRRAKFEVLSDTERRITYEDIGA